METRQAEVTVISARDIKKAKKLFPIAGKMKTYAVVSATEQGQGQGQGQRTRTPLDTEGGTDPNWNFSMRFVLPEHQLQAGHVALTVAVFSNGTLSDRELGRATVPLADFLKKAGTAEFCSYQLHKPSSGKPKGSINISVKLADKPDSPPPPSAYAAKGEPTTAYPAYLAPGSSAYPPAAAYGQPVYAAAAPAGYPPQQGYYPPPQGYYQGQGQGQGYSAQPPPRPQKNKNKFGMGLGAGLIGGALGGLLIGDMIGDAADYDAGYDAGFDDGMGF